MRVLPTVILGLTLMAAIPVAASAGSPPAPNFLDAPFSEAQLKLVHDATERGIAACAKRSGFDYLPFPYTKDGRRDPRDYSRSERAIYGWGVFNDIPFPPAPKDGNRSYVDSLSKDERVRWTTVVESCSLRVATDLQGEDPVNIEKFR
jgi:hypothetical protein